MEDLCTACMCAGRNLYFIAETGCYHLYSQILNEIQTYPTSQLPARVCWECRAALRGWLHFTRRVKRSHARLHYMLQNNFTNIEPEPPRLQICQVLVESFALPVPRIKAEAEGPQSPRSADGDRLAWLKEEDTHCEPETFVHDLKLEPRRKKDKKVDKPLKTKDKSKKKVKTKPEKLPVKKKVKIKKKRSVSVEFLPDDLDTDGAGDEAVMPEVEGVNETKEFEDGAEHTAVDEKSSRLNGRTPVPGEILPRREVLPEKPQCAECGKHFSSRKTYRYHLNVLHRGQNRYPCPRCGKVYQWKSNLGRHLRSHKARDSGELYCALCDKRFASVATYRQHLRVSRRHVPETDFSFACHECGKKFVNKTRLRDHIDWEHLNNIKFRCQLCNKPFKCHTSLYVHLQNVHRNKEKKDNLCHVCGKSYQNAAKLKYHIVAMHTSETPYRCPHCGAAFGWYSSLYRHVREVHYKMKMQPKKSKKAKKSDPVPSLLQTQLTLPLMNQPGPP